MKKIINILITILVVPLIGGSAFSLVASDTASAAACSDSSVLGFPRWYRNLSYSSVESTTETGVFNCVINTPTDIDSFIITIILNIVDMAMVAVGYISFGFILYGGFQFILSLGSSDKMAAARTTILNASIGLVIAISAVAIVGAGMDIIPSGGVATASPSVVLANILDMIYFAAGAASVIAIIISGFTMIVSGDKPDSISKARNGIMFAAIGIVVIIFAKVITTFIIGRF